MGRIGPSGSRSRRPPGRRRPRAGRPRRRRCSSHAPAGRSALHGRGSRWLRPSDCRSRATPRDARPGRRRARSARRDREPGRSAPSNDPRRASSSMSHRRSAVRIRSSPGGSGRPEKKSASGARCPSWTRRPGQVRDSSWPRSGATCRRGPLRRFAERARGGADAAGQEHAARHVSQGGSGRDHGVHARVGEHVGHAAP